MDLASKQSSRGDILLVYIDNQIKDRQDGWDFFIGGRESRLAQRVVSNLHNILSPDIGRDMQYEMRFLIDITISGGIDDSNQQSIKV